MRDSLRCCRQKLFEEQAMAFLIVAIEIGEKPIHVPRFELAAIDPIVPAPEDDEIRFQTLRFVDQVEHCELIDIDPSQVDDLEPPRIGGFEPGSKHARRSDRRVEKIASRNGFAYEQNASLTVGFRRNEFDIGPASPFLESLDLPCPAAVGGRLPDADGFRFARSNRRLALLFCVYARAQTLHERQAHRPFATAQMFCELRREKLRPVEIFHETVLVHRNV
ncbi:hypothetical protein [Methylosinus sp. Sm6]|uniref:hypothetical protein n=1 Tax=Methylosinus sp. Sm6 TaxID=2866948 RepID=UPI001C99A008|nr:hypothetical protein [Methylosinus sp. Sm6]MBY6241918.1 hypothetical protein [Methylosinus sp. Sm6]